MKYLLIPFLIIFVSCSTFKTRTITKEIIKVDTLIKVIPDTVYFEKLGFITDTLIINTKGVKAKSYVNLEKRTIKLELIKTPFEVPITINKRIVTREIEKENTNKSWLIFAAFLFGVLITIYLMKKLEL